MSARLRLGAQAAAVVAVLALLALLLWKVTAGSENDVTGSLRDGRMPDAPVFRLAQLAEEGELSLDDLRGKAVVLNFWASWCGPCKEETPLLERTWQRWQDRDVVFVGVNVKDFRGDALAFLAEYGVTYPNVYDGKGWTIGRYGVTGFPETYFLDARGRVVYRVAGPVDEDDLESGIGRALAAA
ncbi:MAG TPA: TlpA disulfide reductase family protein [Gaiellaceae bacterium]|nr:TlpA disulfide reductase family protein [Gaiellaceae bacterium]